MSKKPKLNLAGQSFEEWLKEVNEATLVDLLLYTDDFEKEREAELRKAWESQMEPNEAAMAFLGLDDYSWEKHHPIEEEFSGNNSLIDEIDWLYFERDFENIGIVYEERLNSK